MASRKEREREFKRQLIAESAFQLFQSSTFEAVTVQDIASAAECGKGTIYQFFTNKDEILYYLISESQDRLNQQIEQECVHEKNTLQALSHYLDLQYQFHSSYGTLLMSLYRRKIEGAANVEEYYATLLQKRALKFLLVKALLQKGMDQGIIMQADSYKMALILNNIVRGFWLGNLELSKEDVNESADLKLIKDILIKGILTDKGGAYFE